MTQDYRKLIVSTPENVTFLHRCFRNSIDSILQGGLSCWHEDLSGTATAQPRNLDEAEQLYKNGKDFGDSAIIIHFPKELYSANAKRGRNLTNRALAYFHPIKKQFTVRPEFIVAWIDRNNNQVHENPYPDRKPTAGHEKFDYLFD